MKKSLTLFLSLFIIIFICSCSKKEIPSVPEEPVQPEVPKTIFDPMSEETKINLSSDGYVKNFIGDFSKYENTDAYRKVYTADDLINAISDAKYHYKNVWNEESKSYTQIPADGYTEETLEGKVHVIEIMNDLNMGYYKLSNEMKAKTSIVEDFCRKTQAAITTLTMSDMFKENGMTQIKVENTSNLLIFSKNGAKLTHCGFKLTSDTNVVFRNLVFDELWQWEDANSNKVSKIGDYDYFGWAYFKISFCGYIWIDHCTFGKSYDGQIDYANPIYSANAGTAFRAPYGADGNNGLHISWCKFNAGSDDQNGYLYQMMNKIEKEYQEGKSNYLYYNKLRDSGISFENILYGLAIPQKKGFLCGDDAVFSGSYDNADDYNFNLKLQISFSNCIFKNLEDRLPKLRGGNAYMYNCIVDSSQYYSYRTKLKSFNVSGKISQINSSWKCGLVSQGIVCGNGGSFKAENCIYKGIETLLKNNDTKNSSPYVDGGYQLINCSYQKTEDVTPYIGSTTDSKNYFSNSTPSKLKIDNFSWHTKDGQSPFTIAAISLDKLEQELTNEIYGSGITTVFQENLLKANYLN